jgi:integrase/recombinase XerD
MIRRRTKAAGIETKIGNHTFRATGITAYLKNGNKLEIAQQIAGARIVKHNRPLRPS